jgi:hypothetical protein
MLLRVEEPEQVNFASLFDRNEDYARLLTEVARTIQALSADTLQDGIKQGRKLRKAFATVAEIDFFPGEAQRQADVALHELELKIARMLAPDEPHRFLRKLTNFLWLLTKAGYGRLVLDPGWTGWPVPG